MMEKLFKNSRYLVFLTIIVSLLSSVTLYVASLNIIFHVLSDFVTNPAVKPLDGQILAVNLLKTLDILLIALIVAFRKKIIINPMTKFIAGLFIDNNKN